MGDSKKRLTMDQVRTLEMKFVEEGGKLYPEKKMHLAQALDLQPRQIAVWFQNRRVRYRNKQLEKNFDVLKREYQVLKEKYDNLIQETKTLQSEVHHLSCGLEASNSMKNKQPDHSASEAIVKIEIEEDSNQGTGNKDCKLETEKSHTNHKFHDSLWCSDWWSSPEDLWQA